MHPILRIFVYQYDASLSYSGSCGAIGTSVGQGGHGVGQRLICEHYAVPT